MSIMFGDASLNKIRKFISERVNLSYFSYKNEEIPLRVCEKLIWKYIPVNIIYSKVSGWSGNASSDTFVLHLASYFPSFSFFIFSKSSKNNVWAMQHWTFSSIYPNIIHWSSATLKLLLLFSISNIQPTSHHFD